MLAIGLWVILKERFFINPLINIGTYEIINNYTIICMTIALGLTAQPANPAQASTGNGEDMPPVIDIRAMDYAFDMPTEISDG